MKIKLANTEDLPEIERFCARFAYERGIEDYSPKHFFKNWRALINNGTGFIYYTKDEHDILIGVIGGIFHDDINTGKKSLTEAFWYVKKEIRSKKGIGKHLFEAFQGKAAFEKVKKIYMSHFLDDESNGIGDFYIKNDFQPLETHYVKEV